MSSTSSVIQDSSIINGHLSPIAKQERLRHVERIHAGIARARIKGTQSGKPIGRPWLDKRKEAAIRAELGRGTGVLKTARSCRVGTGTVQRLKREMTTAPV
jgi:DNA invertase Pin-like site-specific DNA recombinase